MSDNKTHPELGQLLHGNMIGEFNISNIGEAAVMWALRECERVFWNANQRSLEDFCGWDSGDALGEMKTRRASSAATTGQSITGADHMRQIARGIR